MSCCRGTGRRQAMQSPYDRIQYYRLSEEAKASLIAKLKVLLDKEEQVQQAWLFGSFTRRDSVRDIDVAIHAEPELSFKEFLNLNAEIELELGVPVDLVEIAKVPAALKENILKKGTQIKTTKTQPQHYLL
jgi:predicted nucleotidyltransferase